MNKKLAPLRAKNDVTHALGDEIKKHSRTSPDVQFKEFSLTKQKTRPSTDYESTGKTV